MTEAGNNYSEKKNTITYFGQKPCGIYFQGGRHRQPVIQSYQCRCHDGGNTHSQENPGQHGEGVSGRGAAFTCC